MHCRGQPGSDSGLLLSDSGFGQSNFVYTQYLNLTTAEQQRYKRVYIPLQFWWNFGVWKNPFKCLHNTLYFKPRRCCKVTTARAVLHNYQRQHLCPDPPVEDQDQADVSDNGLIPV
ncbi:uncharacterized protein ABDE67_009181 [Symphorus nematophorus]